MLEITSNKEKQLVNKFLFRKVTDEQELSINQSSKKEISLFILLDFLSMTQSGEKVGHESSTEQFILLKILNMNLFYAKVRQHCTLVQNEVSNSGRSYFIDINLFRFLLQNSKLMMF